MKKTCLWPLTVVAGSGGAFALRVLQNRTGFEADTGLPIPGNFYALALAALLAGLTVLFLLLARLLPGQPEKAPFAAAFSTSGPGLLTVLVMGDFALFASGAVALYSGAMLTASRTEMLLGTLTALSAVCLFPIIPACYRKKNRPREPVNGNLLLVPVGCLVVRLVLTFRADSVDPTLAAYYPELLALIILTLSFYHVSSFAFAAGKNRRFALWSALSVVLCATTLADGHDVSTRVFYGACALLQLGLLLLRLSSAPADGTGVSMETAQPEKELSPTAVDTLPDREEKISEAPADANAPATEKSPTEMENPAD